MSKISRLIQSYGRFIAVPWQDVAAPQRVIFCVYNEEDELQLRAKIDEFDIATRQANHGWVVFDLTDTFANWLCSQRYKKSYFKTPELLSTLIPQYLVYIKKEFEKFLETSKVDANTVVALKGVGSIFGFLKVKEIVDTLSALVKGRLVVFFPGTYEDSNYRLLDGYDGWNYLAVTITADKDL
ncbi:MAG: DUF1788 domain-containing protein [Candidatus Bathyarchaeota archaeon]|nr:MAG: DUF1788 domain-containing protein [Candidatus Bathyarchaeota archaeon]